MVGWVQSAERMREVLMQRDISIVGTPLAGGWVHSLLSGLKEAEKVVPAQNRTVFCLL